MSLFGKRFVKQITHTKDTQNNVRSPMAKICTNGHLWQRLKKFKVGTFKTTLFDIRFSFLLQIETFTSSKFYF
jgi:hypothetical protein